MESHIVFLRYCPSVDPVHSRVISAKWPVNKSHCAILYDYGGPSGATMEFIIVSC